MSRPKEFSIRETISAAPNRSISGVYRMKSADRILAILRRELGSLRRQYHVKVIGLFGSYVRGEQKKGSDIDILVEFREPISLFKFLEMEEHLGELLGGKVDLVSKKALKPRIGRRILAEAVYA
jgi:predicted nucleotidyltransferase